jgi:hypothetical protein
MVQELLLLVVATQECVSFVQSPEHTLNFSILLQV